MLKKGLQLIIATPFLLLYNSVIMTQEERMKKLLIVVDYQNDFVTGSLGFDGATDLEEPIAAKIQEYRKLGDAGQVIYYGYP